jgi:Zn-dependent peptidase ImmA (M78 family)
MPPTWKTLRDEGVRTADGVLRAFSVFSPPVPVYEIARSLGAHVLEVTDPGWTGAVQVVSDVPHIWVRGEDAHMRKRFTVAHELGHLLLHPLPLLESGQFRDNSKYSGGPREAEANGFAAELLVPLWMLEEYGAELEFSTVTLANMFNVSIQMMEIRMQKMVIGP